MSNHPEQSPEGNSGFVVAASVLGLVALAQVLAVAWFVVNFKPVEDKGDGGVNEPSGFPLLPQDSLAQPSGGQGPHEIHRPRTVANIPNIDPASVMSALAEPQSSDDAIEREIAVQNKAALFYLDKGMALRNDGDMQGALVHFNSAASLEKDHPRILYEFAITYEKMGLSHKADNFWNSIHALGRVRGGDYYALADFRLKGESPEAEAFDPHQSEAPVAPARKFVEVASAIAEPDENIAEGERVVLNVLIKASPEIRVNPRYVNVRVDFYDLVNESMVDLTRAVPANRWVTAPVDWQNQAEELLEVTYFLPPQADQEILDFGHRAYHGYVIRVYYRDELQDTVAEPAALLEMAEHSSDGESVPSSSEESLFPR